MYRKSRRSLVQYKVFYTTSSLLIIFQFRIDIPTNKKNEIDLSDFHVLPIIRWKIPIEWKRNKTPVLPFQSDVQCSIYSMLFSLLRIILQFSSRIRRNRQKETTRKMEWKTTRNETILCSPRHKCLRVPWQAMVVSKGK